VNIRHETARRQGGQREYQRIAQKTAAQTGITDDVLYGTPDASAESLTGEFACHSTSRGQSRSRQELKAMASHRVAQANCAPQGTSFAGTAPKAETSARTDQEAGRC
jgi:hypothetical protein